MAEGWANAEPDVAPAPAFLCQPCGAARALPRRGGVGQKTGPCVFCGTETGGELAGRHQTAQPGRSPPDADAPKWSESRERSRLFKP